MPVCSLVVLSVFLTRDETESCVLRVGRTGTNLGLNAVVFSSFLHFQTCSETWSRPRGLLKTDQRDVEPGEDKRSPLIPLLVYRQPRGIPIRLFAKERGFDFYQLGLFFSSPKWKEH